MKAPFVLLLILISGFVASAADRITTIQSKEWLEQFQDQAQEKLCKKGGYFRTCFDVADSGCAKDFNSAFRRCVAGERLPKVIDAAVEGEKTGFKLGMCIGVRLEKTWSERKSGDSKCYARNKRWQ